MRDLYRAIFESAPVPMAVACAADGTIRYSNAQFGVLFGLAPGGAAGRPAAEFYDELDKHPLRREKLLRDGAVVEYEKRIRRTDGDALWVAVTLRRMDGPEGSVVLATLFDLDDRKRIEEEFRESEARFRAVFDTTRIGMCRVSPEFRFLEANRAFCEFLGYEEEELRGRSVIDVTVPEDVERSRDLVRSIVSGSMPHSHLEKRYLRKDGSVVWAILTTTLVRNSSGTPLYFVSGIQDITERKRAEDALRRAHEELERRVDERTAELAHANALLQAEVGERRKAEEALTLLAEERRLLLEHANDFVYRHDAAGVFTYISPAVERVTGYPVQQWLTHYTKYLTDNPVNRKVVEYTEETLRTGRQRAPYLVEIRHRDGREIMLEVSERAYPEGGKVAGIIGVARDVTERHRAQAQLIRSEKLASIGMLVSGVAHEINNPLNVMYGNLKLLAEVCRGTKAKRMIRDALKGAENARGIVEDFRSFARDTGATEPVDLNRCLEETASLIQRQLPPGIRLARRLGRIPPVRCFRGQMGQVFLNLLKNAAEAIEGKGSITLRSRRRNGHVVVEVADTGHGMSAEVRKKLFEPFFSTKPVGKGMGLGLSISAMIVHNHGGRLTAESRPGRGSLFRVELPVS